MKIAKEPQGSAREEKYLRVAREIVLKHLDTERFRVFLFGSRARRAHSRSADLDIGILGAEPLDPKVVSAIREEIEESRVPYHVDLVDFFDVDVVFRQAALKEAIPWNPAKNSKRA